jgi:hypothetical protein
MRQLGQCSRFSYWLRTGLAIGMISSPWRGQEISARHGVQTASATHPASDLGLKRPWREADHSHRTSTEVKENWIYTSTPPYASMSQCSVRCRDKCTPLTYHALDRSLGDPQSRSGPNGKEDNLTLAGYRTATSCSQSGYRLRCVGSQTRQPYRENDTSVTAFSCQMLEMERRDLPMMTSRCASLSADDAFSQLLLTRSGREGELMESYTVLKGGKALLHVANLYLSVESKIVINPILYTSCCLIASIQFTPYRLFQGISWFSSSCAK